MRRCRGVTLVSKVGGTKIVLARTIEGPKVPSEAREAQSAGAPNGWGLGGAVASPQYEGLWGYAPEKFFSKNQR